jgi:putative transcriptional regulator
MMMKPASLTGHLLLAMPGMTDANFTQSVTLICLHTTEMAVGLIINRPTRLTLRELLDHLSLAPGTQEDTLRQPVYQGGPVQTERGFIVHSPDCTGESTQPINDGLSMSSSRDVLDAIARGRGPRRFLVALGYAGWESGQLEREIVDNAWLSSPADQDLIFDLPAEQRWQAAAQRIGVRLDRLSIDAGHA